MIDYLLVDRSIDAGNIDLIICAVIGQVKVKAGTFDLVSAVGNWVNRSAVDSSRSPALEYLIQGLSATTYYQVEVLASNEMGKSQPARGKPFVFLTTEGAQNDVTTLSHVFFYLMSFVSF